MTETNLSLEEQIIILKRKLVETESRVASRILSVAENNLNKDQFELLNEKVKENSSLDMLQVEKDLAESSKIMADALVEVYKAAKRFKYAKDDFDALQQGVFDLESNKETPEEIHNRMIMTREKLFSVTIEYELKMKVLKMSNL